jgi:hypothetical protein
VGATTASGEEGVLFPQAGERGRSTTATGRAVIADAAEAADPELAARIGAIDDWRDGYVDALADLTATGGRAAQAALRIAEAGLASLHRRMVLRRDGTERPLVEALAGEPAARVRTMTVTGTKPRERDLAVPLGSETLRGDALRRQVQRWVADGVVEPSCAAAIEAVIANPDWLPVEGRRIVLLGAGAEMGPLAPLQSWGAEVLAVDVPRPSVAEHVLAAARAGAGIVHVPVGQGDETTPGGDLCRDLPELRAWIAERTADAPLVLASHVYADGAAHVQVSAAADALASDLLDRGADVALAALATPTDAYLVPHEVVQDAHRRWRERGARAMLQAPVRAAAGGRLFSPAYPRLVEGEDGRTRGLADALVTQQGPNYALAKRVQRWRAVVAEARGRVVSFNVAPATSTRSVMRHRGLAAAYEGAHRFGVEVFAPATTRVLMAALLVHDLHRPPGAATRAAGGHPDDLFAASAVHGGLWRIPYELRSALGLAALAGLPRALRRRS